MSQYVFPSSLQGLGISVSRAGDFDVKVQQSLTRKENRFTYETIPITNYTVSFAGLRTTTAKRELQHVLTHLARHFGQLDSFLLTDPADSSVTDHGFAVGDGTTASFQLQRTLGGDIIDAAGFKYTSQTKPYTNNLKNSSFEANTAGLANNWGSYNNETATVPQFTSIVPGMNGGVAQRASWGTNAAGQAHGIYQSPVGTPWLNGQWYTVSVFARATGSNVGKFLDLRWNNAPSQKLYINNPALSGTRQRYVFQVFWNIGATLDTDVYFSINDSATTSSGPTGCFGDLDFDEAQVVKGQHGVSDFQPMPGGTPSGASGTDTPSYWPGYADGYEPIFDLNGDSTFYEDGTWRGRRTLYPFTRTTIAPFSEDTTAAAWSGTLNMTRTLASGTAPDGTNTANKVDEGTVASAQHFLRNAATSVEVTGELRCFSAFLKHNNLPKIQIRRPSGSNEGFNFDLSTGAITSTFGAAVQASGVITDPRWPGWYRVWFTYRVPADVTTDMLIAGLDASLNTVYTGTSRFFYAWGAMCERTSNLNGPTPYIKTPSSTAVTVTDYSLSSSGLFTPASVPAAGTFFSVDMSYFRRVRFAQQSLPVEQLVQSMWAAKAIELVSVKP